MIEKMQTLFTHHAFESIFPLLYSQVPKWLQNTLKITTSLKASSFLLTRSPPTLPSLCIVALSIASPPSILASQTSIKLKKISRVSPGYLHTLKFILCYLSSVAFQSRSGNSCSTCDFQNVPQRVNFSTGSSVPPKVNFGAELRWISKSVATANVEVLEEIPRVEWSYLYALANDAPASYKFPKLLFTTSVCPSV
jgi:hypothetical protein